MSLTLSTFQVQPATTYSEPPDLTLRVWYSNGGPNFLDVNGVTVQTGNGNTGFYIPLACSVSGNVITVASGTVFTTLDAQTASPQSIQVSARFYSGNTAKQFLFTNWFIPSEAGYPGGAITFEQLTIENEATVIINPPQVFWTSAQVQDYFNTLVVLNSSYGTGTLVAGASTTITPTAAVAALITTSSPIGFAAASDNITGNLHATNRVAGTSFQVYSDNGADAGAFKWFLY